MKAVEQLAPAVGTSQACQSLAVPRCSYYRSQAPRRRASSLSGGRRREPFRYHNDSASWRSCTRNVSSTKPLQKRMRPCWTRASICVRSAPCTAFFRTPMKFANAATRCGIRTTRSQNRWPPALIKSGRGISPSCWGPPNGLTSTCT